MSTTPKPAKQPPHKSRFRKKAMVGFLRAWKGVENTARDVIRADVRPSLPGDDLDQVKKLMTDCLNPKGGEVSARAYTAELGKVYMKLNATGRSRFFHLLADELALDHAKVNTLAATHDTTRTPTERSIWEAKLRDALIAPRSVILKQFTALPDGFKFLVDMRAQLMPIAANSIELKELEMELKRVLSLWFDVALLDLVEVRWDTSPAALLEKLIKYEAVHQIRSWEDMKNRLDSDRKIYAFLHPKMPLEPLIFVQVAFVKGMADNVQELLDVDAPSLSVEEVDTAIFYSISNAQAGLAGISFGNFLIKRVVAELMREHKQIRHFATLSPIPAFRKWLDPLLKKGDESLFDPAEKRILAPLVAEKNVASGLLALLNGDWYRDQEKSATLRPIMLRLAAHYLLEEKKGKMPRDPVSKFHLLNGARLERLNWLADTSPKGLEQSAGMMVNYYYKLSDIDENHEAFARDGKIVASKQVRGYV